MAARSSTVAEIVVPAPPDLCQCPEGARTEGQAYTLTMPSLATDPLHMTNRDGATFSWAPTELLWRGVDSAGQPAYDYIAGSAPSQVSVDKRQVRYSRLFPQADDVFHIQAEQVKHHTILWDRPRSPGVAIVNGAEFGVSGITTGVPLPLGVHESMLSSGFGFGRPVARDMAGAECYGRYEVIETDGGLQLINLFPAEWVLDPERVYPINLDPTVTTTTSTGTLLNYNQRKIDAFPNDDLVALFGTTTQVPYASKDAGQTWASITGGSFTGQEAHVAVDEDGNLHAVYGKSGSNGLWYRFATVSADRLSATLGTEYQVAADYGKYATCVPVKVNSTTYRVLLGYSYNTGTYSQARFGSLLVNVTTRTASADASNPDYAAHQFSGSYWTSNTIAANAARNRVAMAWNVLPASETEAVYACVGTYSGGVASFSAREQVSPTGLDASYLCGILYDDQDRPVVVFRDYLGQVRVYRRAASAATWTDLSPTPLISAANLTFTVDGSDIWILYGDNGNLQLRKYDSAWQTSVAVPGYATPTMRAGGGGALDWLVRGTNVSPYEIWSGRQVLNLPPLQPGELAPNGTGRDATLAITLSATAYDDEGDYPTDAQWQLTDGTTTWYVQTDGTLTTTATWVATGGGTFSLSRTIAAGQLTNGKTIQWRVKTRDQATAESPWSNYAQFSTTAAPVTTIVSPADGATLNAASVTMNISVSGSFGSAIYRVYADNDGLKGTLLSEETGVTSTTKTLSYDLTPQNGGHVWLAAQATSADSVQGAEVSRRYAVVFTLPATPSGVVIPMPDSFPPHILIQTSNPAPSGGQPTVSSSRIRRRKLGATDWTTLGTCAANGEYEDYSPASGIVWEYQVQAIGDNGTVASSATYTAMIERECWWFVPVGYPELSIPFMFNREASITDNRAFTDMDTLGRFPVTGVMGKRNTVVQIQATYPGADYASPHDGVSLTEEEWRERFETIALTYQGYLCSPKGLVKRGILKPAQTSDVRDMVINPYVVSVVFEEKAVL